MIFFLFVQTSAPGQSLKPLIKNDELPQSFVSGLVQDTTGFIWVATLNGLARFDGHQFKIYQHHHDDPRSIASNLIISLKEDRHGDIWIEHDSGQIDQLAASTGTITHFQAINFLRKTEPRYIRKAWTIDADHTFWAITPTNELTSIPENGKKPSFYQFTAGETLSGVFEDSKNNLWVLAHKAIYLFDRKQKRFQRYAIPGKQLYPPALETFGQIVDIHQRLNGELMWADRQALWLFDTQKKRFRNIPLPKIYKSVVMWIRSGPDGKAYFETGGDVFRFDDPDLIHISTQQETHPLDVTSFLVDRQGLIWVGTNAQGIYRLDVSAPHFDSFQGDRQFPSELLLQQLNISFSREFNWTAQDKSTSNAGYHFRSFYEPNGRLWMALKKTVCYYDPRTKRCIKLPVVPFLDDAASLPSTIKGLTIDPIGCIWVISSKGQLMFFDKKAGVWHPFWDHGQLRKLVNPDLLPQDMCYDDDKLWLTTEHDGLIIIDLKTDKIKQIKAAKGGLPSNQLLGLLPQRQKADHIWIGTYEGLVCLNKKNLSVNVFSLDEGLPDNNVYSVLEDTQGFLWLTTNKGLCRFDPVTHRVRIFKTTYGLPGNEYNRFHHFKLPDGRIAFGGPYGWTVFDPSKITDDRYQPQVGLTDLQINNKTHIAEPLNDGHRLVLPYDQNTLKFSFAGFQYNLPDELVYRYRLIGYDKNWVPSGHATFAHYTRVPPGKYVFQVNTSNTSGMWSKHTKSLLITIEEPWWNTWWAYLIYLIIGCGAIWQFIAYRVNSKVYRRELALKQQETAQLKELDKMKDTFFSNITHEFRTPLSLILGPAERLRTVNLSRAEQESLAMVIKKNAERSLELINQLLDFAKIESGTIRPILKTGSPAFVIRASLDSFLAIGREKGIKLSFTDLTEGQLYRFDSDMLEKIAYNMISNAVKFTPFGGHVVLHLLNGATGVKLIVRDNGIGIPAEQQQLIFKRFYQLDPNGKQTLSKGTGIGLALVQELVNIQGGKITVESKTDNGSSGTIFLISLPYKKADSQGEDLAQGGSVKHGILIRKNDADQPKCNILLVEDNDELANYVIGRLSPMFNIQRAVNGQEGLDLAVKNFPDIVISDILMPVMDGYDFCKKMKEDIRTSHIPIILLTAKNSQEDRMEGLASGADAYLIKPFYETELLLKIQNLLQRQAKLKEHLRKQLTSPASVIQLENPEDNDAFISKLHGFIEDNLDDSLFNVEELVVLTGISRTSLHRKVKALSGLTTSEFIRNYKLKRATVFLLEGLSSTVAANKTGFSSPAYFTKCFRELYGMTPSEFIRQSTKI
ncbi:hybrid sensor histidine kinase/response regulator transcription factor [Parapedobacter koreensis]|uniref:hybrid sensor histidine kinase/response regulator transcription factor n=1 Tax=Parapedobacter koreensis TaxID=332977 RepID=UPI0015A5CA7A|nr:hybrid sensor histidine kinase/response regulator transcription factor [Parapedobacter koreensis]